LSHGVKLIVCASCVALRLKIIVILIMSYNLSWMSLRNFGVHLEPSSALKLIVWGYLDWEMRTLRSAFIALCDELVFVIQPESSSG
jgi:hypothetical protein